MGIYSLLGLGLNVQWGYAGLLNFGYGAFMMVGTYTTVLLTLQGVPWPIAPFVAMAVAAGLGGALGLLTLRLREDYLAVVTIGVAEVLRLVVVNEAELTGGTQGLQGFPVPGLGWEPGVGARGLMIGALTLLLGLWGWGLWRWLRRDGQQALQRQSPLGPHPQSPQTPKSKIWRKWLLGGILASLGLTIYSAETYALYYYNWVPAFARSSLLLLLLGVLTIVVWAIDRLMSSPWGRVLQGIREDETLATALGKSAFRYKVQALMLGGAIAALAGAFYGWQLAAVFPDSFKPQLTFDAWTIVVLGGSATLLGPLLGSLCFWGYDSVNRLIFAQLAQQDWSDSRLSALRVLVIGLLLMLFMVKRPQGLLGDRDIFTLNR